MKPLVLLMGVLLSILNATAQFIAPDTYSPDSSFTPGANGWTALTRCDDCAQQVNLPFSYRFGGVDYTSLYIQTNGGVTFGSASELPYVTSLFPISTFLIPTIAPYYSDVDTRTAISGKPNVNRVWYKVYDDRLVVIWDSVGRYNSRIDSLNKFQLMLGDNSIPVHRFSKEYDIRFSYDTLRWVFGDLSAGSYPVAGYYVNAGNLFNVVGSLLSKLSFFPGRAGKTFQFNFQDPQPLANTGLPAISYPSSIFYTVSSAILPVTPGNSGGAVSATSPYGSVTTYAGSTAGFTDNVTALSARFNNPAGIAVDRLGNVYVSDPSNSRVRLINTAGTVSTYSTGDASLAGLATDLTGKLYKTKPTSRTAIKMDSAGTNRFTYGSITGNLFTYPTGIAADSSGNVYVADRTAHRIRFSTASGNATTISMGYMSPTYAGTGTAGRANGAAASATFNQPSGVALDEAGNLYVADQGNNEIRKITPAGAVSLFAGNASGTAGSADGTGSAASFNQPYSIATDRLGNVYVADVGNNKIRKITAAGVVTTFAGDGVSGLKDTTVAVFARFSGITGVATDQYGNVYVSDGGNSRVRKISVNGYTISPALPAGFTFDPATGTVSGTSSTYRPPTTYTVTAYNMSGSSTSSFVLEALWPLGIKLGTIRADNKGAVNEVYWTSISEAAGDKYEVQRSVDGSSFTAIGTVAGTAVNGGSYTYTDQSPVAGVNYYRLKLLNTDGSIGYSQVVSAVKKDNFGVTVFPNPAQEQVTITIGGQIARNATVSLFDAAGKQQLNLPATSNKMVLSLTGLPSGVYMVKYHDDEHSELIRIMKK